MLKLSGWKVFAFTIVTGLLCLAGAGYFYASGPFASLAVSKTELPPVVASVAQAGDGGDPKVLHIGVTWLESGWCAGQFDVEITQTDTKVIVGTVISTKVRGGICLGLGTSDNLAWVPVQLTEPLGNRSVVRESDGVTLPMRG